MMLLARTMCAAPMQSRTYPCVQHNFARDGCHENWETTHQCFKSSLFPHSNPSFPLWYPAGQCLIAPDHFDARYACDVYLQAGVRSSSIPATTPIRELSPFLVLNHLSKHLRSTPSLWTSCASDASGYRTCPIASCSSRLDTRQKSGQPGRSPTALDPEFIH